MTRNTYDAAGRLTQTEVYSASDTELNAPSGTIQTTKYYYDALGQLDSLVSPGIRGGANTARNQSWLRDRRGNPIYEFPGNGSYIARLYDGLGRLKFQDQSQVSTVMSADGEPFAAASTETFYEGLNLSMGPNLSAGQQKHFYYDWAGNLIATTSSDNYLGSTAYVSHDYEYDGQGKVVREGTTFGDGVSITRSYEYNRRGQRTQVADTVSLTGGGSVGDGETGLIEYDYDATTGRLDSLVGWSGTTPIGRVRWGYDFGGRQIDRWVTIGITTVLHTKTKYDAQGRVDSIATVDTWTGKEWYRFSNPTYSALDELTYLSAAQGQSTGSSLYTQTFSYATDGTRRLLNSQRNSFNTAGHAYSYDVFGNRLTEANTTAFMGDCDGTSSTTYGVDNRLNTTTGVPGASPCGEDQIYYHDQAGNRLAVETKRGGQQQRVQKMSYTAARQLYFSLTATYVVGDYDVNWHWYDAGGKRVITHSTTTTTWFPQYDPDTGTTTYYVYDGADVALTVTRIGTSVWAVPQRFLVGGVDQPLLGRFQNTNLGTHQNLALIGDRQGSTIAAVKKNGGMETQSTYFSTDAFGAGDHGGALPGGVATGTGYTGASTPNANGGFVYLRNRWYDPQTGRFLTQDPPRFPAQSVARSAPIPSSHQSATPLRSRDRPRA